MTKNLCLLVLISYLTVGCAPGYQSDIDLQSVTQDQHDLEDEQQTDPTDDQVGLPDLDTPVLPSPTPSGPATPPPTPATTPIPIGSAQLKIMFIGNSLTATNAMPTEFQSLAKLNGYDVYVERYTAGGKSLSYHINRADVKNAFATKKWDFVVIQEYSDLPLVNPAGFLANALAFDKLIKANGAKTVLFQNWPYVAAPAGTIDRLNKVYSEVSNALGNAPIAPLGRAVDFVNKNSKIDLYTDTKHPTAISTYMGASIFLKLFYKVDPVGNVKGGAGGLPALFKLGNTLPADFDFVQRAAALY